MDEQPEIENDTEEQAELSKDLISSDLIPEEQANEKLFGTEELQSFQRETPEWLDELGGDDLPQGTDPAIDEQEVPVIEPVSATDKNLMPDWLSELNEDSITEDVTVASAEQEPTRQPDSSDEELPDWLGEFETEKPAQEPERESPSLAWLERLAEKQGAPEEELITSPEEREYAKPPEEIEETEHQEEVDDPLFAVSYTHLRAHET